MSEMLTVADMATRLKINPETVRRWLRSGQLSGVLLSDRAGWRIPSSEIDRMMPPVPADQRDAVVTRPSGRFSHGVLQSQDGPIVGHFCPDPDGQPCRYCLEGVPFLAWGPAQMDAPAIPVNGPESRISDERLAEIEAQMTYPSKCGYGKAEKCYHHAYAEELFAEVRRLRRENRLLNLSRGSSDSLVGMD